MKKDTALMTAIVVGGAAAVVGALVLISRAKPGAPMIASGDTGVGAVIRFQSDRRQLSGWGTPGFGRGRTGAAIYWRRVA